MDSIISANRLKLEIVCNQELIIIDSRPITSIIQKEYIKNAFHVDLNIELSNIKQDCTQGGRHPLPTPERFSDLLSSMNIRIDSHIVIYDEYNNSMASARLWWMIKSAGIMHVQVLDGGLNAAKEEGLPIANSFQNKNKNSKFIFNFWELPLVAINSVRKAIKSDNKLIIDVRSEERFNGIVEPIDLISGHIPMAMSIPFSQNINKDGTFISKQEIKDLYNDIFIRYKPEDIIIHCGSGVTACHTLLALDHAGFELPNLYVGSWSEWSRNLDNNKS